MSGRTYTVAEIDALRQACENKYLWGRYGGSVVDQDSTRSWCSRSFREDDLIKAREEMARTFMLAGLTAADLFAAETNDKGGMI